MTTELRAHFDGKVLVPDGPVDLPQGQSLKLLIEPEQSAATDHRNGPHTGLAKLAEELAKLPANPNSPGDLSVQHDHYLYGTPKRKNP